MKRSQWLIILALAVVLAGCARAAPQPTTTPAAENLPAPTKRWMPTLLATEAAFTSLLPTPWPTETEIPISTPWPTVTPLPALPPSLPAGEAPSIAWMQAVGYWDEGRGGTPRYVEMHGDGLVIADHWPESTIAAFSLADGAPVWRYLSEKGPDGYPRHVQDFVGMGDAVAILEETYLQALDSATGQQRWRIFIGDSVHLRTAAGDSLYLLDFNRYPTRLTALDATSGQARWHYPCRAGSETPIYASTSWLFIACQDEAGLTSLAQLSAQTGALVRLQPVPTDIVDILGYQDGVLLFTTQPTPPFSSTSGAQQRQLTVLDWETGTLLWQAYLASDPKMLVDGDGVLIAAGNQLQRRALRSGDSMWIVTLPEDDRGLLVDRAVQSGDELVVGSSSGVLYAFDGNSGELRWTYDFWGMFDQPWQWAEPVGSADDGIVVSLATQNGAAVASLQRDAALAAWPTPTFLSAEAFAWPTPSPTSQPSRTPPPANWQPAQVPWRPDHWGEFQDSEDILGDDLLTWLTLHPGDYAGFNQIVSQWPPLADPATGNPSAYAYPQDYVAWVQSIDLDGDGQSADVLAFGLELKTWMVLQYDDQGVRVLHRRQGQYNEGIPQLLKSGDLNCDGKMEIAVLTSGVDNIYTNLIVEVKQWDGSQWRDLGMIVSSGVDAEKLGIQFEDLDGDGCLEAIAIHDGVSFNGPSRGYRNIYAYRDGSYQIVDTVFDPSPLGYFKVLDARRSLAQGDLDQALTLALDALEAPTTGLEAWNSSAADRAASAARVASYAAAEAMLVHALRGDAPAMQALLTQTEARYARADNPFLPAARALWQTYDATGDAMAACRALERSIRLRGDPALLVFNHWAAQQKFDPICPLD